MQRRDFLKVVAGGAVVSLGAGWRSHASQGGAHELSNTPSGGRSQLTIKNASEFRILQFTDIHFFGGFGIFTKWMDPKTIEEMHAFVQRSNPHLLAITGDLWFNNPGGRGEEFMNFAIEQIEALGVPWVFTWGNHDRLDDYDRGHRAFTGARGSLYRGLNTGGNYIVEIQDCSGKKLWNVVCVNSGHDGVQGPQRMWMLDQASAQEPGGTPPAFAFFHIPLRQYEIAWTNAALSGERRQHVAFESENGTSLSAFEALNVRACFCGHDHVNDFAGMYGNVELVYGRATGYGGYGSGRMEKGCKLITVDCASESFQWTTLLPGNRTWEPAQITRGHGNEVMAKNRKMADSPASRRSESRLKTANLILTER